MAYSISGSTLTSAFQDAADLLTGLGVQATYTFHDGTASVSIPVRKVLLRDEELIGDFEQGDCRFFINASDLPKAPERYDSITDNEGITYSLVDYLSCSRSVDGTVILYTPVARG